MKCPNCGNENPPDYLFCDECGARLIGNDIAAATGGEGGDMQPQDAMGGDSGGGNSDTTQSNVDSPIASYGDYNVGAGLGTGETVSQGVEQATEQPGSTDAGASIEPAASVPVTEDTVSTGQTTAQDAADGIKPLQSIAQADYSDAGGSDAEGSDAEATSTYQDAEAGISGVADDARNAVDDGIAAVGGADWTSSAAPDYADESVPAPSSGGDDASPAPEGNAWASHALSLLDQAQGALSSGDWGAFGNNMNDLRAALQNVAGGVADTLAQPQSSAPAPSTQEPTADVDNAESTWTAGSSGSSWSGAEDTSSAPVAGEYEPYAPTPITAAPQASDQDMGAGTSPEPSYMGMNEPVQQADSTASAGMVDNNISAPVQDTTLPPAIQPISISSTNSGPMPSSASAGNGARLILISSGAEMALPDQEEITVGREDPSSGIFPDVDLTPHGGEDGGVSRRQARLLHVGDDYFVEDLQSTNFTKLDGQRLPAHVRERLDDGARLDFGRVAMIFRRG